MTKTKARAISPAIATIALIAVAIVATAIVGSYVINQSSTLKQDLSADINEAHIVQLRNGMGEWDWGVTIKNTGTLPITGVTVTIRQDDGTDLSNVVSGIDISPSESRAIDTTTLTSQITSGTSYTMRIQISNSDNNAYYTSMVVAEGL